MFSYHNGVPKNGGVARINREGTPVWVRSDYSHHWPTVFSAPDGQEVALVPGATLVNVPAEEELDDRLSGVWPRCRDRNVADHLVLVDGDGTILQDIRLIDRILESPFAAMLTHTTSACDILHLNYIDRVREDVRDIPGVVPGDYIVSLRNISAFGILDSQTGEVKLMFRGTFIHQHSVQHLRGSEFILLDNNGGDVKNDPSRVLVVDLASGVMRSERSTPQVKRQRASRSTPPYGAT